MMIDPPIDQIIKKTSCRYELVMGVTARAKQLIAQEADYLENTKQKPITVAAREVFEDKVIINRN